MAGAIDDVLRANARYAQRFTLGSLPPQPARRLAVVACMDPRISVERALRLKPGDAQVLRNAGGVVTDDVVRSLIIGKRLLGVRHVVILGHTDCDMASDGDARTHVLRQMQAVRTHPWLTGLATVRGLLYDLAQARIEDVASPSARSGLLLGTAADWVLATVLQEALGPPRSRR